MNVSSARDVLVSKIKFYEKMSRKTRKSALKIWHQGGSNSATYEYSLSVADYYDGLVMDLSSRLAEYDKKEGL